MNWSVNHEKELREVKENALRAEYQRLERRKDAKYKDKLDGCIAVDKYDELVEKTEKRMSEIDNELAALSQDFGDSEMTSFCLLEFASNTKTFLKVLTHPLKTKFCVY